jgi:hypothetical protein
MVEIFMIGLKKIGLKVGTLVMAVTVAGCSTAGQQTPIDPAATLTLAGGPIVRTATDNGQISVLDVNQQQVVFSGYVKKGETVTLDPEAKQLTVGGEVAAANLRGGDEFQITFDAAP